ncbi:hypothetical protein DFH08DRAFT_678543 [Mycena albidolilacea]|uniref:Uncharacterized protein n=1 Tax=Mycena albidolilacea TaxID=1033008 RepID=A0AAD7F2U5_9AGAR|nr:hypothetical protein DFH08DRAFT_678543 [Mycena albidolilacea]
MPDLESKSLTSTLAPEGERPATSSQQWAPLQYSASIVFFALCYATMAVIAWATTCYLSFKPIGAKHYGVVVLYKKNDGYGSIGPKAYHQLYAQSEEWFRAARVLAAIVATLTIPVVTSVCARAAVAFHQRQRLTLRQTMTLANKAWIEPATWLRLVGAGITGRGNFASSFLIAAIFLNLLGGIIAPLQQLYLSTATIKTPTWPILMPQNIDLMDHFSKFASSFDFGETTALLRDRLASTGTATPQAQLWSRNMTCNSLLTLNLECVIAGGQYTFSNMSLLEDPFFAQLPSGFSTGLIRQFAPRINSTARRESITKDEFPQGCDALPGAFYVSYENISALNDFPGFTFEACMPANMSATPWRATRDRQDFSEVLYLAVNLTTAAGWEVQVPTGAYFTRITVNTSAGFFELPNYMNGGIAGPLLAEDPTVRAPGKCDLDCETQTYDDLSSKSRRATPSTNSNGTAFNATQNLENNVNKGPLLQTALALFGLGSFIDVRTRALQSNSFGMDNTTALQLYRSNQCTGGMVPFLPLLRDQIGQEQVGNPIDGCSHQLTSDPADSAHLEIMYYLSSFVYNRYDGFFGERITNAFSAAAFLANQAWLLSTSDGRLMVSYDLGTDLQVPLLSLTGIIVVSVLLGLFLLVLLSVAVYAWRTPTWTTTLDAFAMLRIGAAVGAPLRPTRDSDEAENERLLLFPRNGAAGVAALDQMPGWVGDASPAEGGGAVGQLALGTGRKIMGRGARLKYRCD